MWPVFFDAAAHQLDAARVDAAYSRLWGAGGEAAPLEPDAPDDGAKFSSAPSGQRGRGQGHETDPVVRRAVEERAMALAEAHYRALRFDVQNTAATKPYDLRCLRDGLEVRVEAKGTRREGTTVEITIGEVENARGTSWRTDLFVVSGIDVTRADGAVVATGGTIRIIEGWRPAEQHLAAIRFRYTVPQSSSP